MYKKFIILFGLLFCITQAHASSIFDYPTSTQVVANSLPILESISCKFTQEKKFKTSDIKSGGNFQFIKDKGVIFETLYPVKSTTTYTSSQNKQISSIITGIANKNYTFIDKNFQLYYTKHNNNWTLALKPKPKTPPAQQLKNIIIYGDKNINQIDINTLNGTSTYIKFYCN